MHCDGHKDDIHKIGYTSEIDLELRALQLSRQTASPGKFSIITAVWVKSVISTETHYHETFSECRRDEKYDGATTKPEFFNITEGSKDWKYLMAMFNRETAHGGIKWDKSHGKYRSTDLFAPFEDTKNNRKIKEEDEAAQILAESTKCIINSENFERVNTEASTDDEVITEALEQLSFEPTGSHDEEEDEEEDVKRRPNKKYCLGLLNDGAIIETPLRLTPQGKPMQIQARYTNGCLQLLDGKMKFDTLAEFGAEFVRQLGWNDAVGVVFKHSEKGKAVMHEKTHAVSWGTMLLVEGNLRTLLKTRI
jgi:hypothetical protein